MGSFESDDELNGREHHGGVDKKRYDEGNKEDGKDDRMRG